jgi:TRAP-type C4-dicarboxylate transport system substrate-binding protein
MRSLRVAVTLVLLLGSVTLVAQRAQTLRLSTIAPANSVWDRLLKQMATDWRRVTDGRVRLRIVSGGSTGDESTVIRRMRLNNPQMAALTQPGLGQIDAAFGVFGIPFFFESDTEARHVLEQLTPRLEEALARSGLVLLGWGHTGWLHIFSSDPVLTLDDLRRTKIFTPSGDDPMVQWYKENGFQPVPLAIGDVLMGLNTGLINAYPSPPYGALLFQWYRQVSHMLDVPLSPVFAATVMTQQAWRRIDAADQTALRESAKAVEDRMWAQIPPQDREAVQEMERLGLTVNTVDEATLTTFRAAADELTASWRGRLVPSDLYDLALRERNAFRSQ